MLNRVISIVALALLSACAPVPDEDTEDEAPVGELEAKQQAAVFSNCSSAQINTITAVNLAVRNKIWESLANYDTFIHVLRRAYWFGNDYINVPLVQQQVKALTQEIYITAANGGPKAFYCAPNCQVGLSGFTFPRQTVALCPDFFTRALSTGDNGEPYPIPGGTYVPGSQVGILIHEYAHYIGYSPQDAAFGPTQCRNFAINNPSGVPNADNWRMYLMQLP